MRIKWLHVRTSTVAVLFLFLFQKWAKKGTTWQVLFGTYFRCLIYLHFIWIFFEWKVTKICLFLQSGCLHMATAESYLERYYEKLFLALGYYSFGLFEPNIVRKIRNWLKCRRNDFFCFPDLNHIPSAFHSIWRSLQKVCNAVQG